MTENHHTEGTRKVVATDGGASPCCQAPVDVTDDGEQAVCSDCGNRVTQMDTRGLE